MSITEMISAGETPLFGSCNTGELLASVLCLEIIISTHDAVPLRWCLCLNMFCIVTVESVIRQLGVLCA
eukprot:scaffold19880_cov118-Amphora_coffeaeformis.AAC.1